ncbi:MAG TPA: FAD-binding oxidoreductase, partial [Acidimicrobiales bacterium]|nr:FAD-binding oxidoreductase [Acidimicrobiales bacterium]
MADARSAHGYHELRVKRVVDETPDTKSFALDVPAELADLFTYRPGQFCTFRVRIGDEQHLRSYSMSSAPESDPDLTVTVKRVPGGLVSTWFLDSVEVGDTLELTRPAGVFCLRDSKSDPDPGSDSASDSDRPVVAFCGGSGVTPVISLIKSALLSTDRPARVFYANRSRDSVIFADALDALCRINPQRLEVRHHIDSEAGYPSAGQLAAFAGGGADARDGHADFYICGPAPFMTVAEGALLGLAVRPDRIHIERFSVDPEPPGGSAAEPAAGISVTVILKGRKTEIA